MTRANDLAGYFIVAMVALSPIPFGSNRPFFWALSGTLVGLAAMTYFAVAILRDAPLRVPLRQVRAYAALWLALAVWLCLQALPLGAIFGSFEFKLPDGSTVLSDSLSLAPGSTWLMLVRMTSYALIFVLALQAGAKSSRARWLLIAIFWAIVLHAAFSLLQLTQLGDTILGFPKDSYLGVATGTFVNRNSFATFLAMGLSIGVSLLPGIVWSPLARNQSRADAVFRVAFYGAGLFVIVLAMLATESRMGLFAGAMGGFVVTLLVLRWLPRALIFIPAAIAVALTLSVVAIWVFGQGLLERVLDLGGATTGRLDLYQQVLVMIAQRPWLGYGGGAFELTYPSFFGPPLTLTLLYNKAHSTYLTLISELGLVGALLPILIFVLLLLRLVWKQLTVSEFNSPRLAAIGAIVVSAIHSTVDFSLEIQANAYLLVVLVGIGLASSLNVVSKRVSRQTSTTSVTRQEMPVA